MHLSSKVEVRIVLIGVLIGAISSCTALREVANLRKVRFEIDRVERVRLAQVDFSDVRSYEDLSAQEVMRLGASIAKDTLPLSFTLHVTATNPSSNDMNARLTRMDWTLLLEDKETVSGTFDREVVLPPGEPTDVGVDVHLDLLRFFEDNVRGLVDLASALAGTGPPQSLKLRLHPTVNTDLGRFKYPSPITIGGDVGQQGESMN